MIIMAAVRCTAILQVGQETTPVCDDVRTKHDRRVRCGERQCWPGSLEIALAAVTSEAPESPWR
jgi:hypothetical protein